MLKIETYLPTMLSEFISRFDYYCWDDSTPAGTDYSLLPLGTVQLIYQFGTNVSHSTTFSQGWLDRPNVCIAGPFDQAYQLKSLPLSRIFTVTFKPAMFRYFTAIPVNELKNQLVQPQAIWGSQSEDMVVQLTQASSNRNRIGIIERFLLSQFRDLHQSPIEAITSQVSEQHQMAHIDTQAKMANLSISRFRQRFTTEVGLSPKVFQKLKRVNSLSQFQMNNQDLSLTRLAYQFGYFDQSHFIRDFKSVTNSSPGSYFEKRRFLQFLSTPQF